MPTKAEYEAIFDATTRTIFELPYKNRSEAHHIIALANAATIKKRNELTEGITRAWKEGFAALKEENDNAQGDRDEWRATELDRIRRNLDMEISVCQSEFK